MGNYAHILSEIQASGGNVDSVRRKYLKKLHELTGRNVIAFYSGWLQKRRIGGAPEFSISDADVPGFMTVINGLDRSAGLDLVLHTPGGEINATEALVNYLQYAYKNNIRALVPQLAMSAGTMIALSCRSVVMGQHSSLGPIDPQVGGAPAHAIIKEFEEAQKSYRDDPAGAQAWRPILEKYTPTLVGNCKKAIEMSDRIVGRWLESGMLAQLPDEERIERRTAILKAFGSLDQTLNHGRHFGIARVRDSGVTVEALEDNKALQEALLSVHHAYMITMQVTTAVSIIENHQGGAYVSQLAVPQDAGARKDQPASPGFLQRIFQRRK